MGRWVYIYVHECMKEARVLVLQSEPKMDIVFQDFSRIYIFRPTHASTIFYHGSSKDREPKAQISVKTIWGSEVLMNKVLPAGAKFATWLVYWLCCSGMEPDSGPDANSKESGVLGARIAVIFTTAEMYTLPLLYWWVKLVEKLDWASDKRLIPWLYKLHQVAEADDEEFITAIKPTEPPIFPVDEKPSPTQFPAVSGAMYTMSSVSVPLMRRDCMQATQFNILSNSPQLKYPPPTTHLFPTFLIRKERKRLVASPPPPLGGALPQIT